MIEKRSGMQEYWDIRMGCIDWDWVVSNKHLGEIRDVRGGQEAGRQEAEPWSEWLVMMGRVVCSYCITTNR